MQISAGPEHPSPMRPSAALRVMLLTDQPDGAAARHVVLCGGLVETAGDLMQALAAIIEDPIGYDLFVMDCDGFGGVDAGARAVAALIAAEARMRVILVSREFDAPAYPFGRRAAVCLPAGVSEAAFRKGVEHVLRDRPAPAMM